MTAKEQQQAGRGGVELRSPDAHLPPPAHGAGKNKLVWGALAAVILLGLAVVLVLPRLVVNTPQQDIAEVAGQSSSPSVEASESTNQALMSSRAEAERAMQDFLHVRARLELANAPVWGEPEWGRAVEGADRGNSLFTQGQFSMAARVLTESLELMQSLEAGSGQRLADALDSGWRALQADDSASALLSFETALSIDADNDGALDGLERARVRPQLLHLMADGELARSTGDLVKAQAAYHEAVDLDGAYDPADLALQDVDQQLLDIAFRDAMNRALNALGLEQIEVAEAALKQAASLKPGEEVVANTRQQLAQTRQKLWIAAQRQAALQKERDEDWSGAVAIYHVVLARVPQAGFAHQGLEFAEDRARLHRQLDHYLEDPTRIYSDQPRANAEQLLESAANPPVAETRLAGKIQRLQILIVEAQKPRTITLQSDGLTSVQIYHVGRLGQFITQQLDLLPGTYTIVGSRSGFRDVRQTFTVTPGADETVLDIRCGEPV